MSVVVEMLQTMTHNARQDADILHKVRIDEIMKDLMSAATLAASKGKSSVDFHVPAVSGTIQNGIKARLLSMKMPVFSVQDGFAETSITIHW